MKIKYLYGAMAACLAVVLCAFAAGTTTATDFDLAKQEIMLRKIGHEILLQSGDSTSRVLPVKKIAQNEYQLQFENEFTFRSDSLVSIIKRTLAANSIAHNYIVNVSTCHATGVVFGYAILNNKKNDIIACTGRKQPKNCYRVNIKFQPEGISMAQKGYLIGGIPLLAFVGLLVFRSAGKKQERVTDVQHQTILIGNTIFNADKKLLSIHHLHIELTHKESRLLFILASQLNQTVNRSRLQKEIWEDEGVIVGRSLDMFVSKLRKKLEHDAAVKLVNIHGKGYKLEVNAGL